ncbi:MAG: Phosphoenolpyruvate synthase [Parcubacteria group bacterium GW2011_GWE2_38_18]|nr:MAG: Phosphoenolpyruvate synthase [Parcubacteria group bacterium GW2011_GWE2_38_18]
MYTKTFIQLNKNDSTIAGGKGASLGEMIKAKMPVPPGFVVLADAFNRFLVESDLLVDIESIIKKVNHNELHSVTKASETIRQLIDNAEMSRELAEKIITEYKKLNTKFVAVRSSATAEDSSSASWAGELETYLHVTENNLLKTVKLCWSSLFTPRAIYYRFEKKMHKQYIAVAVVVQKMIDSEVSGIVFTVHPITKNKNQMIIEAGFGLGEAIVSGQITPDAYVVDKRNFSILDINIAQQKTMIIKAGTGGTKKIKITKNDQEKQKLSKKQIINLTKLCLNIEKHYNFPCDIEWAFEKGKFYITQSRPITAL